MFVVSTRLGPGTAWPGDFWSKCVLVKLKIYVFWDIHLEFYIFVTLFWILICNAYFIETKKRTEQSWFYKIFSNTTFTVKNKDFVKYVFPIIIITFTFKLMLNNRIFTSMLVKLIMLDILSFLYFLPWEQGYFNP